MRVEVSFWILLYIFLITSVYDAKDEHENYPFLKPSVKIIIRDLSTIYNSKGAKNNF